MKKLTKQQARQQSRLHEQLDFFGAKKKRFISVYASKPRIRLKVKSDNPVTCHSPRVVSLGSQQLAARAAVKSALANQQSQLASMGASGLVSSQFGLAGSRRGLGQNSLFGLGSLDGHNGFINPQLTSNVFVL